MSSTQIQDTTTTAMKNLQLGDDFSDVSLLKNAAVDSDDYTQDDQTNNFIHENTDEMFAGVNSEDCIPLAKVTEEEEDGDSSNKLRKKYSVNPGFDNFYKSDVTQATIEEQEEKKKPSIDLLWLPTILKEESWPEENSAFISDVARGDADINNDPKILDDVLGNPLQSTIRNTVIMMKNQSARENAAWKKAQKEEEFNKMINSDRLKDIPTDQSSVPNTFANKFSKKPGKDFVSPMKLFGYEDTFVKKKVSPGNINDDSKLPIVMENSEKLYKKILRNSSSNGNMITAKPIDSDLEDDTEDTNNENINEDITSDAEEFSSFPSTTRKLFKAGDQLFQNIQNRYQKNQLNIPQPKQISQSDYTSAEENSDENIRQKKNSVTSKGDPGAFNVYVNPMGAKPSIATIRKHFYKQARAYQQEFNISPPKLQSKFRSNSSPRGGVSSSVEAQKFQGLKFIPADDYKDKVFDKNLNTFVLKSEYLDQNSNSSSYTDDFQSGEYGNGEYKDLDDDNEGEDDKLLVNFSTSDLDVTTNSVKKVLNKVSTRTLGSIDGEETDVGEGQKEMENRDDENEDVSFSVTDKLLIECISKSYPVEQWESVERLDINNAEIEQLFHLDKMTPNIWFLNARNNCITQNFGIPKKVQYMDLSFNLLSNISAKFDQFMYLQVLNLSHNQITDLRCLKELRNLTSLDLSDNEVQNIAYLENFKMLHYLNLSNNKLKGSIDFSKYTLWFLEDLIIDDNEIEEIMNICELSGLINISANNNRLHKFEYYEESIIFKDDYVGPHTSLRRICLNNTLLAESLDLTMYVELKEVQIDNNHRLLRVDGMSKFIEKVSCRFNKNLSLINNVLKISLSNNNLKVLYLSGGKLPTELPQSSNNFSSVTHLDISAMGISELPARFNDFFPLLIDLNLNFNRLKNLKGLENSAHLKLLKVLGNDIESLEDVVDYTSKIRMRLKMFDLRVNPLTREIYPFVFYDEEEGSIGNSNPPPDETTELAFQLQDAEDIDAFAVEYSRMYTAEGLHRWALKNRRHQKLVNRMNKMNKSKNADYNNVYVSALLIWFPRLSLLDGTLLSRHDRAALT